MDIPISTRFSDVVSVRSTSLPDIVTVCAVLGLSQDDAWSQRFFQNFWSPYVGGYVFDGSMLFQEDYRPAGNRVQGPVVLRLSRGHSRIFISPEFQGWRSPDMWIILRCHEVLPGWFPSSEGKTWLNPMELDVEEAGGLDPPLEKLLFRETVPTLMPPLVLVSLFLSSDKIYKVAVCRSLHTSRTRKRLRLQARILSVASSFTTDVNMSFRSGYIMLQSTPASYRLRYMDDPLSQLSSELCFGQKLHIIITADRFSNFRFMFSLHTMLFEFPFHALLQIQLAVIYKVTVLCLS